MKLIKVLFVLLRAILFAAAGSLFLNLPVLPVALAVLVAEIAFGRRPQGALSEGLDIQDTSYDGETMSSFISLAATGFETIQKGVANILPGIKKSQKIPTIKVKNFIQAHKATPTHGGSALVDVRRLTPLNHMGYMEFNPRDFEQHAHTVMQNGKLLDQMLPQTAEAAIVSEILKYNGAWMETNFWQAVKDDAAITTALANGLGDGDNNMIFMDGMQKKIFVAPGTHKKLSTDMVNPSVALTVANIYEKLELVAALLPTAVYEHPKFKFIVGYKTGQLFKDAQKAQQYKGVDKTQAGVMLFDGKPVVSLQGVSNDTIIAGLGSRDLESNFWMGVHEIDEEMFLDFKRLQANSEEWFIKMLMKIDVNFAFEEQTAMYTLQNYA